MPLTGAVPGAQRHARMVHLLEHALEQRAGCPAAAHSLTLMGRAFDRAICRAQSRPAVLSAMLRDMRTRNAVHTRSGLVLAHFKAVVGSSPHAAVAAAAAWRRTDLLCAWNTHSCTGMHACHTQARMHALSARAPASMRALARGRGRRGHGHLRSPASRVLSPGLATAAPGVKPRGCPCRPACSYGRPRRST